MIHSVCLMCVGMYGTADRVFCTEMESGMCRRLMCAYTHNGNTFTQSYKLASAIIYSDKQH